MIRDSVNRFVTAVRFQLINFTCVSIWTDNYVSPLIQNECLKLMTLNILRMVGKSIRDSGFYFSIMADECTDIANKEQFFNLSQMGWQRPRRS